MAITQIPCPDCQTKIFVSVSGDNRDVREKECPRCGARVAVSVDADAHSQLEEEILANTKRTGTAADERFADIVSRHSQDVDEVISEIRDAYQTEMQKIESQSDIPTLEHVKEDIDDALKYIEEDTESMRNIMSVGRRKSRSDNDASSQNDRKSLRQRARNMVDAKIVSTIADRYLDGDTDDAKIIYDLSTKLVHDYGNGSITRDNLIDTALEMELDEEQMQAVYRLLGAGRFGEIISMLR